MPDLMYGYASTRIKAMETRLLSRKQMADLYGVSSLPEMTVLLQETSYKDALVHASQKHSGIELLLVGFQDVWMHTLRKVEDIIPARAKPALDVLLREWELQDIKTICAKKALGQPVSIDELTVATDAGRKLAERLLEQKDWAGLVAVLRLSWTGDAVRADEKRILEQRDFRALSQALDRTYAKQVSAVIKGKDHPNTRQLLKLRQEFLHSMIVLRLKSYAKPEDIQKELFGSLSLNVQALIKAPDLDAAIALLDLPDDVLAAYRAKPALSTIELALEKRFIQGVLRTFRASVLNFGVVIGYLYLKSAEIANLKRLALGKHFGVEEQFRPFLVGDVA
ncbi:V-type ATPase subunit [Candidatus Micrarchaeota archaeon]|nr:V-type ATPase subunit [Candidatus Micrarchaeota archaeon]